MPNRKIGALWSKKTKKEGKEHYSGVISDLGGDIQILVFKNDKKQNQNQPDYNILLSKPKEGKYHQVFHKLQQQRTLCKIQQQVRFEKPERF